MNNSTEKAVGYIKEFNTYLKNIKGLKKQVNIEKLLEDNSRLLSVAKVVSWVVLAEKDSSLNDRTIKIYNAFGAVFGFENIFKEISIYPFANALQSYVEDVKKQQQFEGSEEYTITAKSLSAEQIEQAQQQIITLLFDEFSSYIIS